MQSSSFGQHVLYHPINGCENADVAEVLLEGPGASNLT